MSLSDSASQPQPVFPCADVSTELPHIRLALRSISSVPLALPVQQFAYTLLVDAQIEP
jgi:hypothetical protein